MVASLWNSREEIERDGRGLRHIRVLLIEDDKDDYVLIDNYLAEVSSAQYEVTWVQTCEEGLKALDSGVYDVCLLDFHLGAKSGLEILSKVEESTKTPPIIVLTGQGDYRLDVKAMEYGAADYLLKDQMNGHVLERAIRYSMDRKKSKDALSESERQLEHLASALIKVQESERKMVAAELHDDLGQLLMAIKFHIESVLVRMDPNEPSALDLEALIPKIKDAVERVRNLYTQLVPNVLDDLGILATLRWFCREFRKEHPNIKVESEFGIGEDQVSADLKLMIFRIVQDAFKNVADHSRSCHARISLVGENGYLRLEIRDDGTGFDVSHTMSTPCSNCGVGLMSMKKRAELSGGSFQIGSSEGRGTFVSVSWPLL